MISESEQLQSICPVSHRWFLIIWLIRLFPCRWRPWRLINCRGRNLLHSAHSVSIHCIILPVIVLTYCSAHCTCCQSAIAIIVELLTDRIFIGSLISHSSYAYNKMLCYLENLFPRFPGIYFFHFPGTSSLSLPKNISIAEKTLICGRQWTRKLESRKVEYVYHFIMTLTFTIAFVSISRFKPIAFTKISLKMSDQHDKIQP